MLKITAVSKALLGFYAAHELPGLFVFLLIEETGVPLLFPGDALIIAAGSHDGLVLPRLLSVILTAAAASALGSSLLYVLVRRGGRPLLARYGRFLHLNERRVDTLDGWFRKHGALAIVVGRLIPGLRTPTTVMSGLFGVPYRVFAPATTLAAVIWASFYYALGLVLAREGRHMARMLLGDVNRLMFILGAIALFGCLVAAFAVVRRLHARVAASERYRA